MEIYLNVVEWDPGVYGIEAARQHYFDRPAAKLTARQAALLAVTLPNPDERNPASPARLNASRRSGAAHGEAARATMSAASNRRRT